MKKILVSGLNPAWQKLLLFPTMRPGEVNRARHVESTASGKGINFARAAKTWGKAETRVFQFAGGVTGDMLTAVLKEENIRHLTAFSGVATRVCTTVISETPHSVTELIEPTGTIPEDTVRKLFSMAVQALPDADALAICGTYPPGVSQDFYASLIREANQIGKFVLLDSFMNVECSLQEGVSLLKVNLEEILKLSGTDNIFSAVEVCIKKYSIGMIAVTAGPDTAYFFDGGKLFQLAPPKIDSVANTIGAGDTCSSIMLSEIVTGTDPLEAFQLGLSAASASCMTQICASFDKNTALKLHQTVSAPKCIKTY